MKIFNAKQIREGDAYTIAHEPITSIDLMERASHGCVNWIKGRFEDTIPFYIFCGTGNNGGDGLAIARLLGEAGYQKHTFIVFSSEHFSIDCETN
ncbi:MAG: NAD(P)H-hydrate epimerase, partial [Chitinophagaceae bacterium]